MFPGADLDLLAGMEHDRWVKMKLAVGWRYDKKTAKDRQLHRDLVPWSVLTPEERVLRFSAEHAKALGPGVLGETARKKDRTLVREIPRILARVGYAVVRAHNGKK